MAVYGHTTKFNEGNACPSRHSSSPPSVSDSFITHGAYIRVNTVYRREFVFTDNSVRIYD